jgi:hypothetical protein
MSRIGSLPFLAVLLLSLAWVGLGIAVLGGPWIRAERWMRATVEQTGIAAVSFSLASTLWRLAVVFVPPLVLIVAWLRIRLAA